MATTYYGNLGLAGGTVFDNLTPSDVDYAPVFIGPDISDQALTEGDAFSLDVSVLFEDLDNNIEEYALQGDWPSWVTNTSGVLTGTSEEGTWSGLYVTAVDATDLTDDSNTFSIIVSAVPPTYSDVDEIRVENRGTVGRRAVYDGSGLELRVRCIDSDGAIAYPTSLEWRLLGHGGEELTDWATLSIVDVQDADGNYTDVYADLEIAGTLNDIGSTSRNRYVVISAARGETNELTTQWKYTVRKLG